VKLGVCGTALVWSILLGACAGTETGNPSFDGSLGYEAYSSAPRVAALTRSDPEPQALRVDHAWLVLGDVELLQGDACGSMPADGPRIPGLGVGDHAGGHATATRFELAPGQYCGARLPFSLAGDRLPTQAPDSLHAESIELHGELPDGRAFELRSSLQTSVLLRAHDANFALDGAHAGVLIGFDVAKWLGELDWTQASADEQGRVLVSAEKNAELLRAFEQELPRGIALFRDSDGDGMLDADHTPIADGQ
jgi:hypothetical protein